MKRIVMEKSSEHMYFVRLKPAAPNCLVDWNRLYCPPHYLKIPKKRIHSSVVCSTFLGAGGMDFQIHCQCLNNLGAIGLNMMPCRTMYTMVWQAYFEIVWLKFTDVCQGCGTYHFNSSHELLKLGCVAVVSASPLHRAVRQSATYLVKNLNVSIWNLPQGPLGSAMPAGVIGHVTNLLQHSGNQAATTAVIMWLLTSDEEAVSTFLKALQFVQKSIAEEVWAKVSPAQHGMRISQNHTCPVVCMPVPAIAWNHTLCLYYEWPETMAAQQTNGDSCQLNRVREMRT